MIFIFWNLLKLALWPSMGSLFTNTPVYVRIIYIIYIFCPLCSSRYPFRWMPILSSLLIVLFKSAVVLLIFQCFFSTAKAVTLFVAYLEFLYFVGKLHILFWSISLYLLECILLSILSLILIWLLVFFWLVFPQYTFYLFLSYLSIFAFNLFCVLII